MNAAGIQKTCFVVMGFGEKTDFQTKRLLDLDKTYRAIIKPAVLKAGLKCVRADDVVHSGDIDKIMYELLLNSDAVIADLSTCNANAIYELGIRHALRPHTTIIIAESQFKYPFDLSHIAIEPYQHLGKGIDFEEAEKVRDRLAVKLQELLSTPKTDSPVYTFLQQLSPPTLRAALEAAKAAAAATVASVPGIAAAAVANVAEELANSALLDAALKARAAEDFVMAAAYFDRLKQRRPHDPYVIQQLALATYKSKLPNAEAALAKAQLILRELDPEHSSDPETLGLWGAIHKRLWDLKRDRALLDVSLGAYERGFYLRDDSYTGINYAYLLNERAGVAAAASRADAIADFITARRVRQRVIERCKAMLAAGLRDDQGKSDKVAQFWTTATLIEGYVGVGDDQRAGELVAALPALEPEPWMMSTLQDQLKRLRQLTQEQAPLANV
ncbi:MAG TPA: TRAFs-binding domain-containing protein [Steroidobacteraceae bacterium]|nr:TRAFs-binding domain-containing protein [Steroidobacteraceae bacterium]